MSIDRITLYLVNMRLTAPFETSFGVEQDRQCVIVRVDADGLTGWGECPASRGFGYSYETTTTVWHALKDFLIPHSLGKPVDIAATFELGEHLRGHNMARHGLESALWDIVAQQQGISLSKALGGTRDRVAVGVSIGIQPSADALIAKIESYLAQGYGRIKIKIKPGYDLEIVKRVRAKFPKILLQVDANSAYHLPDAPLFEAMDEYKLLLIEQPFGWDDIYEHSKLQPLLKTPVCLDESIHSLGHAVTGDRSGRVQDHQHQTGARERLHRITPHSRSVPGARSAGVVRRHAGDGHRARGERGVGLAAQLHPARRHQRQQSLLRGRHRRTAVCAQSRFDVDRAYRRPAWA